MNNECLRCGKQNVDIHTCNPTKQWKAGYEYALENKILSVHKLMIKRLKIMDEEQLIEMFHDLNNIKAVERISDCAFNFIENFPYEEINCDCEKKDFMCIKGKCTFKRKSEHEEWREDDDRQRYRDIKSTQDAMK